MPSVAPSFDYSTGKVSIANGENVVVGTGLGATGWGGAIARRGDVIVLDYGGPDQFSTVVVNPIAIDQLEIPHWTRPSLVDVDYIIYWISPTRVAGAEAVEDVSRLVNYLNTAGIYVYVDPADSVPDPSLGEEGQSALQPSTGKLWVKVSGVWDFVGVFKGFSPKGEYDAGTTYIIGDVVSDTIGGASYISKVDGNIGNTPSTSPDEWMVNAAGLPGPSGATILVQNAAPATTYPLNTLWIDADSTDLDVYQLSVTPAWVDTGMNLRGIQGPSGTMAVHSVSTGVPGSSVTFVNVGTPQAASFDISIPAGNTGATGTGIQPNASGTLAGRAAYDGAAANFIYLRTDVTPNILYIKNSATSGDWSSGTAYGGDMLKANNLSELPDKAAARNNLQIFDSIVAAIVFGG